MARPRAAKRLARIAGGCAAATVLALGFGAPAASALPEGYHYELVSPPDKNGGDVGALAGQGTALASPDGERIGYLALGGWDTPSYTASAAYVAVRGDESWKSTSLMLPAAPLPTLGGPFARGLSEDATRAISLTNLDLETGEVYTTPHQARQQYLVDVDTRQVELLRPALTLAGGANQEQLEAAGNEDFSRVFFDSNPITQDAVDAGLTSRVIYLYANGTRTLASVDPDGTPVSGRIARGVNAIARNAEVLYFNRTTLFQPQVLYRRDVSGPNPETVLVNADENSAEAVPEGSGTFVGGSEDGEIAYFTSTQRLVDEDTDDLADVYRYDHSQPEGSRLTLISVDSEPNDAEAAADDVHVVSADGSAIAFSSQSQLVAGEPAEPGSKLYIWHDGELSYVGPTDAGIGRDALFSEDASILVFRASGSGITPEDNGGFPQIYRHDVTTGTTTCLSCVGGGEANTEPATLEPGGLDWLRHPATGTAPVGARAARNLSSEGQVFFETAEPLVPGDTNGRVDVYVWKDGVRDLISTGRGSDDSHFADASVDGSSVFFTTRERLSRWDFDNNVDMYVARLGDPLPEPEEPVQPCRGADCQGPPPLPPAFLDPVTDSQGPGNPGAVPIDCSPLKRQADRAANKAKRLSKKAQRLARRAGRAAGQQARRLRKAARQARRQAMKTRDKARKAKRQLALCNEEEEL